MAVPTAAAPLRKRVVVAMSGGVDSSVAAYLLRQQRNAAVTSNDEQGSARASVRSAPVIGLFMNNWNSLDEDRDWNNEPDSGTHSDDRGAGGTAFCTHSEQDRKDAQAICDQLDVPLHSTSFAAEYWTHVFAPFVAALSNSTSSHQMPNPDVMCNSEIKFGKMKDYCLKQLKVDAVATGHYARLWRRHKEPWMGQDGYTDVIVSDSEEPSGFKSLPLSDTEMPVFVRDSLSSEDAEWMDAWGRPPRLRFKVDELDRSSTPLLLAAADLSKDQSYFLSMTPGAAFHNVLFPLGYLLKQHKPSENQSATHHLTTVRDIAGRARLGTALKRDSTGICFIGKRRGGFSSFMSQYVDYHSPVDSQKPQDELTRGRFINVDTGEVVQELPSDSSMHVYTIGQGAKISGAASKWFVVDAPRRSLAIMGDVTTGQSERDVWVCQGTHHPALFTDRLFICASGFSWVAGCPPPQLDPNVIANSSGYSSRGMRALCRIRHLQPLVGCEVRWENNDNSIMSVVFDCPLRGVTPGQIAALYLGVVCLGGGPISQRGATLFEQGIETPNFGTSNMSLHPAGANDLSMSINS
jgi:tRNA U34 2-thiouridine synthase MnmA/TrmU